MFQCVQIISKCGQVRHLQRNQIDVGGHRTGDLLGCVSILIDVAKDFIAVHQDLRCRDVSTGCVLIDKNEPRKYDVFGVLLCVFLQ